MTLDDLGWNAGFAEEFAPFSEKGWKPARLIRDNKITYGALLEGGDELEVVMGGKVYHDAETDADLPAVGDWVALELGQTHREHVIRHRLTRQNTLSRKMPGRGTEEQVIAANIQVVVVVTDSGPDFNLRRMERYFAIIGRSGARVVVLLNKSDLYTPEQTREASDAIQALNPIAEIHVTTLKRKRSLHVLKPYLQRGISVAFVGSSGVGKSSLINYLLGDDYQWTEEVNENTGKGRHATTARELIVLPGGGIIIDNPGIREVHMWTDETILRERFADLEELAGHCKYDDCTHGPNVQPADCALRAAIQAGTLDSARMGGFVKLEDEITLLRANRKKRQLTVDRRARRDLQIKSRKYHERSEPDHE